MRPNKDTHNEIAQHGRQVEQTEQHHHTNGSGKQNE
jgi:hypothetical protein